MKVTALIGVAISHCVCRCCYLSGILKDVNLSRSLSQIDQTPEAITQARTFRSSLMSELHWLTGLQTHTIKVNRTSCTLPRDTS